MNEILLLLHPRRGQTILHGNARSYVSAITFQKLRERSYRVLPRLAYFSDLSPVASCLMRDDKNGSLVPHHTGDTMNRNWVVKISGANRGKETKGKGTQPREND